MVYHHPVHQATLIAFGNKLDVSELEGNARDLAAYSVLFVELSRALSYNFV